MFRLFLTIVLFTSMGAFVYSLATALLGGHDVKIFMVMSPVLIAFALISVAVLEN